MLADLLALLVAAGALVAIDRDLTRGPASPGARRSPWWSLPFVLFAGLSLFVAARAPRGRHPFRFDVDLSWEDVGRSLTKVQHLRGYAVLVLLAVVAFGARHLLAAFATTMALGVACELAQTTVVGHNARLADLAPNLVGGLVSLAVVAGLRRLRGGGLRNAER